MGALWFCPQEPAEACPSSDPRDQIWAHLACLGWGLRGSNTCQEKRRARGAPTDSLSWDSAPCPGRGKARSSRRAACLVPS